MGVLRSRNPMNLHRLDTRKMKKARKCNAQVATSLKHLCLLSVNFEKCCLNKNKTVYEMMMLIALASDQEISRHVQG